MADERSAEADNFNPRSRVGNDGSESSGKGNGSRFQSTFPRGERLYQDNLQGRIDENFNPRSRVGNDYSFSTYSKFFKYFNPRSRVGNDRNRKQTLRRQTISIHVPAWGTTFTEQPSITMTIYFNPRSRVGNDLKSSAWNRMRHSFQSTFPRGERRKRKN